MQNHPNRFLRLREILGDEKSAAVIPVSKSAWWAGVKAGRYPQPVKLSPRVTVWRASEIFALVQK